MDLFLDQVIQVDAKYVYANDIDTDGHTPGGDTNKRNPSRRKKFPLVPLHLLWSTALKQYLLLVNLN